MKASGENNGRAKLTMAKVEKIRKDHACGQAILKLALKHDVAPSTIWSLLTGRTWRRIEKEIEENAARVFSYHP